MKLRSKEEYEYEYGIHGIPFSGLRCGRDHKQVFTLSSSHSLFSWWEENFQISS